MKTQQIVLASRPIGTPTLTNFRFEDVVLPEMNDDEIQLNTLYLSVDPYMRGRMNDAKSYTPPFEVDKPIEGAGVAKVTASKSEKFNVGDYVYGRLPWRIHTVGASKEFIKIDVSVAPLSYYLGILGMTGLTAYFGLMDIGKPKAGETVVVSGAAGAVGLMVGQIAKIMGCRVVGITGSDQKVKLLKEEFKFDEVINYKTTQHLEKSIERSCPDGVDIYFDNVGGVISDAVIRNINFHGRIPLCGQISLYNSSTEPYGPRLQPILLTRSVLLQGFIINDFQSHFPEAMQQLITWVKEKRLINSETIIQGFNQLPVAFLGLFEGQNTGKMVVEL
jgi:NADPH-dependent curcumin reductase CurA